MAEANLLNYCGHVNAFCSGGKDGWSALPARTVRWLAPIRSQLPSRFTIHDDDAARAAVRHSGAAAFTWRDRIYLGDIPLSQRDAVLRHEIVHLAQVQLALRTGRVSPAADVEREAEAASARDTAALVRCGADPEGTHAVFPLFIAVGAGLYIMFRSKPANAPGLKDKPLPRPSDAKILGEAICLFVVPGGAMALGGRLGLGFLGSSALAGGVTGAALQAVDDLARGEAAPALFYLYDIATGAALGFVVPGGVRLIGQTGTQAFDRLATLGLDQSKIALVKTLAERSSRTPLTAAEVQQHMQAHGMIGQVSKWYLDRRHIMVLYRGQEIAVTPIVSPLAREQGVLASEELLARLRTMGLSDFQIATASARYHSGLLPSRYGVGAGIPVGAVGIPTSGIPGVAAGFAENGVVYVLRAPKSIVFKPKPWEGLEAEDEWTIFNQVPAGTIVRVVPANTLPALGVNDSGLLTVIR